jgi:hypothetical protein
MVDFARRTIANNSDSLTVTIPHPYPPLVYSIRPN